MSKSDFMSAAEEMRSKLGEGLCLAKWKQVSLHLPTGLNNSCYHPPLHRIDPEAIKKNPGALHNTEHKKQQRVIMLKNERPSECQYCWNMEDLGNLSDRHYRSGEPWAAESYNEIRNSTGLEDDVIPTYVEVNFSNVCNLACSYCSPQFSSTWADDVRRHGAYPTSNGHNSPEYFEGTRRNIPVREDNPYVEAFWQWWPELYPQLRHFRMTGGEPILDKNTYKVFDYVLAFPKPDLHLNVTSNFSVPQSSFDNYLSYVKRLCDTNIEHFMQYVSVDTGIAEQAEYIRDGMNYRLVQTNAMRYLGEVPNRNSLTFIITMNNLSVVGIKRLLSFILDLRQLFSSTYQRVWFDTPVLRQPEWQSLQLLPESYASRLSEIADWMEENLETPDLPFNGFKDYEVQRMRRVVDWMREGQKLDATVKNQHKADFFRFFHEYERRRDRDESCSFEAVFPEMREFWNECRYHASQ